MARSSTQTHALLVGLTAATVASLVLWYKYSRRSRDHTNGMDAGKTTPVRKQKSVGSSHTPVSQARTPLVSNTSNDEKQLHEQIETLDKKGKTLFKSKDFLEAAQAFTEALDLIEESSASSSSLSKQVITLTNNRSAMYEKGNLPDLALDDCRHILDLDMNHTKARVRALRVLEHQKHYQDALVEVCAIQLLFMQQHRQQLRMGLPVTPPVPPAKLEEILSHVLPGEVEKYTTALSHRDEKPLPSSHTILQLLQSFAGYNAWMSQAAKGGSVDSLTMQLDTAHDDKLKRASTLWKRGRRHVFDRNYSLARDDFEEAHSLIENAEPDTLPNDEYTRIFEWTGMVRHWSFNLDGASKCYEKCSELEPTNVTILVKQAGVNMDGGDHQKAIALFDKALGLDPDAVDALLHRANLYMLQQKVTEAKTDLQKCLALRPDHLLAHLRLATILMASNDISGAKAALDAAASVDPDSSEVHSYRGEMEFAQSRFTEAREEFDKAIEKDRTNAAAYMNAALAVLNTPPEAGALPDAPEAIRLLEKALEMDQQFHPAYVHLGQLKLSLASDLAAARQVVKLYDRGLENCRTPEEFKDLCAMRTLAVAQIDAASMLKMETFSMQ